MPMGTQDALGLPTPSLQSLLRQAIRMHTQDLQIGGEIFTDGIASPAAMGQPWDLPFLLGSETDHFM